MIKRIPILLLVIIFSSGWTRRSDKLEKVQYGIIVGENVNMRDRPSLHGKVIYKFIKKEIVFFLENSESQDEINGEKFYWCKVKTQKKYKDDITGWVFGKYFILLDGKGSEEENVLKEAIKQNIGDNLYSKYSLFFNSELKIRFFNNKKYYIFTFQNNIYDPNDSQRFHSNIIFIKDDDGKLIYLTGISGEVPPFEFFDLDDDDYAEIFIKGGGIRVYSEKKRKNIAHINFVHILKGKRESFSNYFKNSYVELKEIDPGKKCEIIAHWIDRKKKETKTVVYRWNGETFVESK